MVPLHPKDFEKLERLGKLLDQRQPYPPPKSYTWVFCTLFGTMLLFLIAIAISWWLL